MSNLSNSIQVADYTLMQVRRPNGEIETVRKDGGMHPVVFAKMQAATKAAGRGDLLSYEVVMRTADVSGAMAAIRAERAADARRNAIYGAMDHQAEKRNAN